MGIFVHEIVEICDPPVSWRLVDSWEDVEELGPLEVGLEADNILRQLLVVVAEQDL